MWNNIREVGEKNLIHFTLKTIVLPLSNKCNHESIQEKLPFDSEINLHMHWQEYFIVKGHFLSALF